VRGTGGVPSVGVGGSASMKRSVIVSLAAVAAGAGLAFGQSGRSGTVFVTEDPAPPPSVIRVDSQNNNGNANRPAPAKPKQDTPKTQPVQQATYRQDGPAVEPARPPIPQPDKPMDPPAVTPKVEVLPVPKIDNPSPIQAVVGDAHGDQSSYSTNVIAPVFPWTKCGKRTCGTVYIETPYFWLDARFLFGWFKKDQSPPLATTGPVGAAFPGALDDPQTTVLFDGQRLNDQPYYGGYFTAGGWFDECQYCGGEVGYFFFGGQDNGFIANATGFPGTPGLYVPFFNPLTGAQDAFAVSQQGNPLGTVAGSLQITSRSQLQGGEGHFLFSFCRGMSFRCDALAGVRWLGLDESLTVNENIKLRGPILDSGEILPADVSIIDSFSTRNDFIGGDFGFKSHFVNNCWSFDLLTRVALGGNHQIIRGDGQTAITFLGIPVSTVGISVPSVTHTGRLVGPANSGVFGNDIFSVVPEIGVTVGYQPTHWCKFTLGYNWMYWTNVVRPGGQVDPVVNPIGVPTSTQFQSGLYQPPRPGVGYNETDIWIQAFTLGMQFTF
jgi:Putative beta barrel porin-7 (BBP7)